jgi:type VI secretion system protein ImpE
MRAEDCLREGNLAETLAELQNSIRQDPSNVKYRIFLFQLLAVMGQWERSLTQLNVAGEMDAGTLAMVQAYREAIQCEVLRSAVFEGKRSPLVFGEPEHWIALLLEAARLTALGEPEKAESLRGEAFDLAPASAGKLMTGEGESAVEHPFQWIADADSRLGPMLEALVNGRYYWIPIHRIRRIDLEAPADLRDIVWTPVHFVWSNGGETVGMIPTRYAGTENSKDDLLRLARKTDWIDRAGTECGIGQRMLVTDTGEFSLMEVRQIHLQPDGTAPRAGSDPGQAEREQIPTVQTPQAKEPGSG